MKRSTITAAAATAIIAAGGLAIAAPAHATTQGTSRVTNPVFHTVGSNVNMRDCAATSCAVGKTIAKTGSAVTVYCWVNGQSVSGDKIWYYAYFGGVSDMVAGYWLDTGHDPTPQAPTCDGHTP